MRSLAELVPRSAEAHPDRPALAAGERMVSYAELGERVHRAAAALHDLGVRKGDRVALFLGNVPAFVEALHGALRIGAVVAPLNVMLTPEEAGSILGDAGARVVVAEPSHLPTVLAVRDRVASLGHVVVTGSPPVPRGTASFEELLARAGEPPGVDVREEDLALLAYTAGTTARPKGAMLTHGNLVANLEQVSAVPALKEAHSDVILGVLPLFHIYALNAVLGVALREGATLVLVERFDPAGTLELVERHRVTVLPGAPQMFAAWLSAAEGREVDLSSVRLAVSGAAPLPAEVLDAFQRRFGVTIWEGYGLTETAPAVTTNALAEVAKGDSIGLALPGVEVRLVDEAGEDVVEGDPGEIVLRGANVFQGYWNRPEETDAAFRDGWFRTGDVAYRDDDGYLFIVDRKKDLIIVSGFNVFPKEVEEALARHPAVAECAVVGVPDERTGEAARALVVLGEGRSATEEELLDHCRDHLARFKWPKTIEVVDRLPKHATGKVLRRMLRDGDPAP
ncbi:MAG: long-chain-fatty-acid--CoA ligase [Actinomycetota bacterium]